VLENLKKPNIMIFSARGERVLILIKMETERAEGYVLNKTKVTGKHLNQIFEKFKEELVEKKELTKQMAFHRVIVEKPFKGKKAPYYLSFSYALKPSKHLFGKESEGEYNRLTIAFHKKRLLPFFHLILPDRCKIKKTNLLIPQTLFSQKNFNFEKTDFYKRCSFDSNNVYITNLNNKNIKSIDFSKLEGICNLSNWGIGTDQDFEDISLGVLGKGMVSSMSAVIDSDNEGSIFSSFTDYFVDSPNPKLANQARAFRHNMTKILSEFKVPNTCVSIGYDYSGRNFYVFTPKTDFKEIVRHAVGMASTREVGMGTIADSTQRLIGLYEGLKISSNPEYADRLKQEAQKFYKKHSDFESSYLLEETLKEMK